MKAEDIFNPIARELTLDDVLNGVRNPKQSAGGWVAFCPAHNDVNARSLKIDVKQGDDGKDFIAFRCHAGCSQEAVAYAIKPELEIIPLEILMRPDFAEEQARRKAAKAARDAELANQPEIPKKIIKTYDYEDRDGELRYQAVRYEPKDFRQRRPSGSKGWIWNLNGVERIIYRLFDIVQLDPETPLVIAEGEKDVDTLWEQGIPATTNVGGAINWLDSYNNDFYGRSVFIVEDNDKAGRLRTEKLVSSLMPYVASINVIKIPSEIEHYDVTDFFESGGTANEFLQMMTDSQQVIKNNLSAVRDTEDDSEYVIEGIVEDVIEDSESSESSEPDIPKKDPKTTTKEEREEKMFNDRMKEIEDIIAKEGELAGLCKLCLDTGKTHIYAGFQGKAFGLLFHKIGETKEFISCSHGADEPSESLF